VAVPGYEILEELGRGGMGVVYKARQRGAERLVALKMILSGAHAGAAEVTRFRTEGQAIARLRHPGIVQIYEVGEQEGRPFFSLEFCEGGSLEKKLAGTPLPPQEAAVLVRALAEAMQAAHDAGIIHRDLKPANVLLTVGQAFQPDSGGKSVRLESLTYVPKITDFGLAKKLDEQGQTQTGSIMGTPSYMAPEQASGSKDLGPAVDVYALGAILYECLTGRPPFRAATPFDTIMQVIADDPVPPGRLQPGVPRDQETVCLKCLRKDPAKRYSSAGALGEDLGRWLGGEPIRARPVGVLERGLKWVRRNPVVAALLALVVSVTVLGVGLVVGQWQRAEAERRDAEEQRDRARRASEEADRRAEAEQRASTLADEQRRQAVQAQSLADERRRQVEQALRKARSGLYFYDLLRADRDLRAGLTDHAKLLLYGSPLDLRGWEWDHLRQRCRDEEALFQGHTDVVVGVSWSGDSRTLASGSNDSTIRFWDPATGREMHILRGHEGWVNAPTFDPKGRWLASSSASINSRLAVVGGKWEQVVSTQVKLWDLPRRAEIRSLRGRGPLAFRPDGSLLAVVERRSILLYDPATGSVKQTLKGHAQPIFALAFTPDGKTLISGSYDVNRIAWSAWSDPAPLLAPGELKIWDIESGKERPQEMASLPAGVMHLAMHPDGRRLVVARVNGAIEVLDWTTGKVLHALRKPGSRVCGLDLDRQGRVVVTPFAAPAIVWDVESGQQLATMSGANQGVAFSPDGRWLAFGADKGQPIRILDARFRDEGLRLLGPQSLVFALGCSADRRHVAALSAGKLFIWDAATGKELARVASRGVRLTVVPKSDSLVTSGDPSLFEGGELYLREMRTGKVVHRFSGHRLSVVGVSCSADGRWLASTACNPQRRDQPGEVRVWDVKARAPFRTISGQPHVFSVAMSPDGALLAGACEDQSVYLWERETGKLLRKLTGHASVVNAVAFRPDGKQLASGGVDGTILLWNVGSGEMEKELRGHQASGAGDGGIFTLAYSPDNKRLASASFLPPAGGEVKVWDVATGNEALSLPGRRALAFDGTRLATGAGGGAEPWHVRIWEARPGTLAVRHRRHGGSVRAIVASADRKRFASVADDATIRLWDTTTGEETRALQGHKGLVWHAAFSTDGKLLASAGDDHTVRVWDVQTGKQQALLAGHTGAVRAVAFACSGLLASAGMDGTVRLWDAQRGTPVRHWSSTGKLGVASLAFSPDGKHVLSSGAGVELRDVATGELLLRCTETEDGVLAVAFAPDGKTFAAGDWEGALRIYDAATGRLRLVLRDSNQPIFALDHRGDCIAAVGDDRMVHLWDADGALRAVLSGHNTWVAGVAFVAGGLVASGDATGEVRLWHVPPRPAVAKPPVQSEHPENESYLARLARQHHRAGRFREALDVLQRWDAVARRQQGRSDPACVALLCLAQHYLARPEAPQTLVRLEDLLRNPRWAGNEEAKDLLRQCRSGVGEAKRDDVVQKIQETIFERWHAGWTRHDVGRHLALYSDDYRISTGRAELPRDGDVTMDRAVFAQQQKLRFTAKSSRFLVATIEELHIAVKGDEAIARARGTVSWLSGHVTVADEQKLRRTPAGWQIYRTHWWPVRYRQGDKLLIYDAPTWKRLDDAAAKEPELSHRVEILLEAHRYREAYQLAKEVTARPGATAADWQRRAEAAFGLGDNADAGLAARRAKALDGNLPLSPYLDAARQLPSP
jgi:WD40 repeat protein